jgi:hypothetical protein
MLLRAQSRGVPASAPPPAPTRGPELVTDPTLSSSAGWTLTGGWAFSDGTLENVGGLAEAYATWSTGIVPGTLYEIIVESLREEGPMNVTSQFYSGGNVQFPDTAPGLLTIQFTPGQPNIQFQGGAPYLLTRVSIKEVL